VPADRPGRALPLWLTVVLGLAGATLAVWGMHALSGLLGPILLAFVLTIVAQPLVPLLVRHGWPRWLAVAVLVVAVDGGLIAFTLAIVVSLGQLATVLPQYSDQWQHVLDGLRSTLANLGIGKAQVQSIVSSIGPGPAVTALRGLLSGVVDAMAALVLLLATALFMAIDAAALPERLAAVPRVSSHLTEALGEFATNTRRYMVVTSVFGFAVAVVDTIGLFLLGIPLALLWGLLSFLTNYVPNIGFFLGLLPPTLLALLVGGPRSALFVIILYSAANFVLQSIVQPLFVGDAVGLAVTVTFVGVIFWTVILGALGAILAIPLTLLLYAVLVGQDPERRWAKTLLAGRSGPPPPAPAGRGSRAVAAPAPPASSARDDARPPDGRKARLVR
jgi:predicted PurR-regulated permease PerM